MSSFRPHFMIWLQSGVIENYQKRRIQDWCVNTSTKVECYLLPSLEKFWFVIPHRLTYFLPSQKPLKVTQRWKYTMPSLGLAKWSTLESYVEHSNRKADRICPTGLNVYCVHLLEATTPQLQQYGTQWMAMGTPTPLLGLSSLNAKLKTPHQFVQDFYLFMDQWQKLVIPFAQWWNLCPWLP